MPAPTEPSVPPLPRRPLGVAVAVSAASAVLYTWPLLPRFFTHLAGDSGDPYPLLWSMQVFRDELLSLHNPFFTDRAFYPQGVSLVFQTANWPGALFAVPLWSLLPAVSVWNTVVLFEFTLTAFGMFLLVRELTNDFYAALVAAVVFPIVPYHMAHAPGHIHLIALGWLPLYLWRLHRAIVEPTLRNGALAGLFLALASLAAWYHLVDAAVLSLGALGAELWERRAARSLTQLARCAVALVGVFAALAGPLLVAMLVQAAREPIAGIHDPNVYSLDLEAFFLPNLISAWERGGSACHRWTGNAAEIAGYLGYAVVILAAIGALRGSSSARTSRAYLIAGLVGATLSLGPYIHVSGHTTPIPGPYLLLEHLPGIRLSGVPSRLACITYVALIVSAGAGVSRLRSFVARRGRAGAIAVCAASAVLPIVEYWPHTYASSAYPAPGPLAGWAKDPDRFSVLDLTGEYRMHWHALLHRKPMVGGAPSRYPYRLSGWYWDQPVIHDIERGPGSFVTVAERVDPGIDFDWGFGSPMPGVGPDDFRIEWRGTLLVPRPGEYTFFLGADDGATLAIDGKEITGVPGSHPFAEVERRVRLDAGPHPLGIDYEELSGGAAVRLAWSGPGFDRRPMRASELQAPDGGPGILGRYLARVPNPNLDREAGRAALRRLGVRYIIAPWSNVACERELGLPVEYRGEGVVIYGVPPS